MRSSTMVSLARQGAGAQQDRQVVRLLDREAAGDLARAAGDRATGSSAPRSPCCRARWREGGRRFSVVDLAEALCAADVEAEIDDRLVGALSKAGWASVRSPPSRDDAALHRHALAALFLRGKHVDIAAPRRARARGGTRACRSCRGCPSGGCGSCRPGTCTRMRSGPWRWMFGSVVPSASTRRRSTSMAWSTARRTRSLTPASVR